ncbi:MAG: GTA-gp10 family protein [Hyphomicrobiaceae bacterium]
MAGNPLRGEVTLRLGEREVVLKPTFDNMVKIEDRLGVGVGTLWGRLAERGIGAREFAVILEIAGGLKRSEVAAIIEEYGMLDPIAPAIFDFLNNAISGGAKASAEKNAAAAGEAAT